MSKYLRSTTSVCQLPFICPILPWPIGKQEMKWVRRRSTVLDSNGIPYTVTKLMTMNLVVTVKKWQLKTNSQLPVFIISILVLPTHL